MKKRKIRSSFTHSNEGKFPDDKQDSDVSLQNNQTWGDLLIDPDEFKDLAGSTYSPITASNQKACKKVKASDDLDVDDLDDMDDIEVDDVHEQVETEGNKEKEQRASTTLSLPTESNDDVNLINNQKSGEITIESCGDFPIVDIDEVDDKVNSLTFASVDNTKLVIHNNRIIATMDEDDATKQGVSDIYLEDNFDVATEDEVQAKGLRAGLRSQGFKLSTIKLSSSKKLQKAIAKAKKQLSASLQKETKQREQVMATSFILASVGLNRGIFKDYPNALKAELEQQLLAAGVQHAKRLVKAAFDSCGIDYAKTLMTAASAIAELPEETRDGLAEQLDMTEEIEADEDEDLYGDPELGPEGDVIESALSKPIKASKKVTDSVEKALPFANCY